MTKGTSQIGTKSPAQNPILKAALSAGCKRLVTLHGFVGESTDSGVALYPDLSLSPVMVIPVGDIVHVHTPADPLEPATLFVRDNSRATFRAEVGGDQMPDLPVATAAHIFAVAVSKRQGVAGTSACASALWKFSPTSDAYSSCYNLCQCLNETDNPVWKVCQRGSGFELGY